MKKGLSPHSCYHLHELLPEKNGVVFEENYYSCIEFVKHRTDSVKGNVLFFLEKLLPDQVSCCWRGV
jgi:hypothetical protein